MIDGFLKVAAATPEIRVADTEHNASEIIRLIQYCAGQGARVLVLPELCVTGYTCGDLFLQGTLLDAAKDALDRICYETRELPILSVIGFPLFASGKLYNTAAVIQQGQVLAFIPKRYIPNYSEYYEARWFARGDKEIRWLGFSNKFSGESYEVPFGMNIILAAEENSDFSMAAEICEDAWMPSPPSASHAMAGAMLIANCSASSETVGKEDYRREMVRSLSSRLVAAYIYADAGEGESTQDLVFSGHNMIAENGLLLAENPPFGKDVLFSDVDLDKLRKERQRMTTYPAELQSFDDYVHIPVSLPAEKASRIDRLIEPNPFVPCNPKERGRRCEAVFMIQASGLKKRLLHTGQRSVVIGLSGGLDSTLALLASAKAFELLDYPKENIICVTMPAFGTTDRTYRNALLLAEGVGASLREINIKDSVLQHFRDIGHEEDNRNVTYENAQARERTQVLMDLANDLNALVVGTGDLSELALGWATYNGDHMSMYGVNAGVPKTLVRHLVRYSMENAGKQELKKALLDILDTPVSPELLPPSKDGAISQKTEDLVGPYELHDFFLYQALRQGFSPKKVYQLSLQAFSKENIDACRHLAGEGGQEAGLSLNEYPPEIILKWLRNFYRRFFSQQFKRSCLPDGPKVGSVSLSPRGDLRMPSDAVSALWLKELDELDK